MLSSSSLQPGAPYKPSPEEVLPEREILIATLSTGPVGQDGLILKPDRPLTMINALISDWALYDGISQGELYSTRTTV
jgi:hypothetical protein